MSLKGKKVLITYGPTWVAIDDVRVISNVSSGELGKNLALGFAKAGAKVTALEGPVREPLKTKTVRVHPFRFYSELANLLKKELIKQYDIVVHAAAVSDYQPQTVRPTKISSHKKHLSLRLIPTAKLIEQIKTLAPKSFLIGFKLETTQSEKIWKKKAYGVIQKANCDLVVVNSLSNGYSACIFNKEKKVCGRCTNRTKLTQNLIRLIRGLA
jgi:phosphopantothenoylcysteine synthetase/decarboxylase